MKRERTEYMYGIYRARFPLFPIMDRPLWIHQVYNERIVLVRHDVEREEVLV